MTTSHLNRTEWENRSIQYGTSLKSVLFKRLPNVVNEHISSWHIRFILDNIIEKEDLRILDIGCGYGRLSLPVIEKFPHAEIVGIDISSTFVELFKATTKQNSFVGNIENIPIDIGKFDYIICVTVLMYVEKDKLHKSLCDLLSLLKHDGILIVIENHSLGTSYLSLFGIFPFLNNLFTKEPINTYGYAFRENEIEKLAAECHAVMLKQIRFPFTTFFVLPISLLAKFFPNIFFTNLILRILSFLDKIAEHLILPSLHIGYIIKNSIIEIK